MWAAFEEERAGIRKKMASSMSTVLGTKESAADRVGSTQLVEEGQPQVGPPADWDAGRAKHAPDDAPSQAAKQLVRLCVSLPMVCQQTLCDAQDPIDAMSDNDFDGPEDTPAVDLGF